jgi:hypothetical protein
MVGGAYTGVGGGVGVTEAAGGVGLAASVGCVDVGIRLGGTTALGGFCSFCFNACNILTS